MTPGGSIPFGPERKDSPWRWGSFLIGVASIVVLAFIATLGGINLIGWKWLLAVIIGFLFSMRAGRAWSQGRGREIDPPRTIEPTVDVRGQAGSTYLLLSPAKASSAGRVRPREFSPGWWALYSIVVRAPVALGDFVLTIVWRLSGGLWDGNSSAALRQFQMDQYEHADRPSDPGGDRF